MIDSEERENAATTRGATCLVSLLLLCLALAWGCGSDGAGDRAPSAGRPSVVVDGFTTTVTNSSAPLWAGAGELVEEASIGTETGDEAYLLGSVTSLCADDVRIYLADMVAAKVRVYDRAGTHLLDIGSPGAGPGELARPTDVGCTADGRVVVRDREQNRVHVFDREGELLEDWLISPGSRVTIGNDGSVYLIDEDISSPETGGNARVLRYGPHGEAGEWVAFPDRPPTPSLEIPARMLMAFQMRGLLSYADDWRSTIWVPFGARVVAEVAADGALVSGRGDAYDFEVHRDDGSVLVIRKEWEPVPVEAGEADWHRRRLTALWREAADPGWVWPDVQIPAHKGAFKYIIPTVDGSFWVIRQAAGERIEPCDTEPDDYFGYEENPCWRDPLLADVFDAEGRFLGSVAMPEGILYQVRPYVRGETLIALLEDADGVARVRRYRLELPD